jgi:translation initiation factor 2 subunit 1
MKSKTAASIMRHVASKLPSAEGDASLNEEERLEKLYEQVAWPLGKKYGHPYDAFKLALT